MFESAELGHKIAKADYEREEPILRARLLTLQYEMLEKANFPVVIIIDGVDGAGKSETLTILHEWMDPRHIVTTAFAGAMSDEERERPRMWRYWRALPPKGRIGILFGAWHSNPILDRVVGQTTEDELARAAERIVRFERMLVDEGALLLKFWFHLSKPAQKARMKALEADPTTRWRVSQSDRDHFKLYDRFRKVSELALRRTNTGHAPWQVVEGGDPNYRYLTVGRAIADAVQRRLIGDTPATVQPVALPVPPMDGRTILSTLDYNHALPRKNYQRALEKHQGALNLLTRHRKFGQRSAIVVFEGVDAAGKGGAVRRVVWALDARHYRVIPIAAPTEEERAQPYLWRFWRQIPRLGRVTIFDRSWYGRVLVERVEGFCSEADWMRGYAEINDFEEQLAEGGGIVVKFWLTITPDEQLARFRARETSPFKSFKITPDDWRNRDRAADYDRAVCDMIDRTNTESAPWVLVPANDKYFARITVLRTLCERIEAGL